MSNLTLENINLKMELDICKKYIMKQANEFSNKTKRLAEEKEELRLQCCGQYALNQKLSDENAELEKNMIDAKSSLSQLATYQEQVLNKNRELQNYISDLQYENRQKSEKLKEQEKLNNEMLEETHTLMKSLQDELNRQKVISTNMAERNKKLEKEALMRSHNERFRNEDVRRSSVVTIPEESQPGTSRSSRPFIHNNQS